MRHFEQTLPNDDGARNMNPSGIGFWALVAEDFQTHNRDWVSQGFWALFWHRFGNWRMATRVRPLRLPLSVLYRIMFKLCEWLCGISLPYTVIVGRRVKLEHFGGMILVAQEIGSDVIVRQNTTFGIKHVSDSTGRPVIGSGVDVGAGAVVLGRVKVGNNAVIGANAVVVEDVPEDAVVGGVPAAVLSSSAPLRDVTD